MHHNKPTNVHVHNIIYNVMSCIIQCICTCTVHSVATYHTRASPTWQTCKGRVCVCKVADKWYCTGTLYIVYEDVTVYTCTLYIRMYMYMYRYKCMCNVVKLSADLGVVEA